MHGRMALKLVKARLGLTSSVRDVYLTSIISGVISELENEEGLALNCANPNHLMLVVDFATWRYESRGESGPMPEHLRYRIRKAFLKAHTGGAPDDI